MNTCSLFIETDSTCVSQCASGIYMVVGTNNVCKLINYTCTFYEQMGTQQMCVTSCTTAPYTLIQGTQCVAACTAPNIVSGSYCTTSCTGTTPYYNAQTATCVSTCPTGYYSSATFACVPSCSLFIQNTTSNMSMCI
jgi:hypothetical protein